jgi:hypothetical protein
MLRRAVLLICALALTAPVVLSSGDSGGDEFSDTQRSISVVIRHCTS